MHFQGQDLQLFGKVGSEPPLSMGKVGIEPITTHTKDEHSNLSATPSSAIFGAKFCVISKKKKKEQWKRLPYVMGLNN